MKKVWIILFLVLIFIFGMSVAYSEQAPPLPTTACESQIPYGQPQVIKPNTVLICRTAYLLLSDTVAKVPVWNSYVLTPAHSTGCLPRSNSFEADASLPKDKRSAPSDYVGSGFDMGHMADDADMSWDVNVERESFLLTNMSPQYPATNRISWRQLEENVRAWALERQHSLLIYVGPIYDVTKDPKIGENGVDVPSAFYKIIVDVQTHEVMAFIYPNLPKEASAVAPYKVKVADVQQKTGIIFPLPIGYKETALWPVDLGVFAKTKKTICSAQKLGLAKH